MFLFDVCPFYLAFDFFLCDTMLVWVLAMAVCLFVCLCLFVTSRSSDRIGWFLAWKLPSTYPTLCYKEIGVPSKIKVLPS